MINREDLEAAVQEQTTRKEQAIAQANFSAGYLQCLQDILDKIDVEPPNHMDIEGISQ